MIELLLCLKNKVYVIRVLNWWQYFTDIYYDLITIMLNQSYCWDRSRKLENNVPNPFYSTKNLNLHYKHLLQVGRVYVFCSNKLILSSYWLNRIMLVLLLLLMALLQATNCIDIITTVAGTGTASFSGDSGAATSATLNNPIGVALDSSGTLTHST